MSGYFDNYILKVIQKLFAKDRVVDIGGVRALTFAREKRYTDPTEQGAVEIKGLKIVMPKDNKPNYFDDLSYAVEAIYKEYRLTEVCLPGVRYLVPIVTRSRLIEQGSRSTPIRVKGNYAFDFPTTLGSSLSNRPNGVKQVGYFKQALGNRIEPHERFVEIMDWDSFLVLSDQLDRQRDGES